MWRRLAMNEQIYKLVARMVVATMIGQQETVQELYEQYLKKRHLYVSIKEMLEAKRRAAG